MRDSAHADRLMRLRALLYEGLELERGSRADWLARIGKSDDEMRRELEYALSAYDERSVIESRGRNGSSVAGMPVDLYCDTFRLGITRRLLYFLDVCRAVQKAHDRGVVFGNLRLHNVLVNSSGSVRIHDSAVAPDGADSHTDILALGRLLHGLVSTSGEILRRRAREDLNTIVLHALQEDPRKRYRSVAQLMQHIEHYVASLPTRSGTMKYRVEKFMRRLLPRQRTRSR